MRTIAPFWQYPILALILLNAATAGLEAQWDRQQNAYWQFFLAKQYIDIISTLVFILEIGLKWLDDFGEFFASGWNCFDLALTVMVCTLYIGRE